MHPIVSSTQHNHPGVWPQSNVNLDSGSNSCQLQRPVVYTASTPPVQHNSSTPQRVAGRSPAQMTFPSPQSVDRRFNTNQSTPTAQAVQSFHAAPRSLVSVPTLLVDEVGNAIGNTGHNNIYVQPQPCSSPNTNYDTSYCQVSYLSSTPSPLSSWATLTPDQTYSPLPSENSYSEEGYGSLPHTPTSGYPGFPSLHFVPSGLGLTGMNQMTMNNFARSETPVYTHPHSSVVQQPLPLMAHSSSSLCNALLPEDMAGIKSAHSSPYEPTSSLPSPAEIPTISPRSTKRSSSKSSSKKSPKTETAVKKPRGRPPSKGKQPITKRVAKKPKKTASSKKQALIINASHNIDAPVIKRRVGRPCTPKDGEPERIKPYNCLNCEKGYDSRRGFLYHLKTYAECMIVRDADLISRRAIFQAGEEEEKQQQQQQ